MWILISITAVRPELKLALADCVGCPLPIIWLVNIMVKHQHTAFQSCPGQLIVLATESLPCEEHISVVFALRSQSLICKKVTGTEVTSQDMASPEVMSQ